MRKVLLFLLLFLAACSKPLYEGTVTDKHYDEAHRIYSPMIMNVNKHTQIIPRWIHYPDRWYVSVQNGEEKDIWEVTEEYYDSVEVGDYITSEQRQKVEAMLRKWIDDWEEDLDIYMKYKDSEDPREQKLANKAKEQMNEIAEHYNKLILKYGYLFGETLPEGIYAAIEKAE